MLAGARPLSVNLSTYLVLGISLLKYFCWWQMTMKEKSKNCFYSQITKIYLIPVFYFHHHNYVKVKEGPLPYLMAIFWVWEDHCLLPYLPKQSQNNKCRRQLKVWLEIAKHSAAPCTLWSVVWTGRNASQHGSMWHISRKLDKPGDIFNAFDVYAQQWKSNNTKI